MATIIDAARNDETHWWKSGTVWDRVLKSLALLTGFSIPLSTSFSEICTTLFIICWVASGDWRTKGNLIRQNTVALWATALFALLMLGVAWSSDSWLAATRCLLKYREFLYIPMFLIVFRDETIRRSSISAFLLGGTVLLGMSYSEWLFHLDLGMESASRDFVIGKDHIIHSLIMAIVIYLTAGRFTEHLAQIRSHGRPAVLWTALYGLQLLLGFYNELCMLTGRTGYVVLAALVVLFCAERLGRRGVMMAAASLVVVGWGAFSFVPSIQARVDQTVSQIRNQLGAERKHSPDPRMEFYANALQMISRHPWRGTGTGSFEKEYLKQIAGTDDAVTVDPHNEYLHLASQVGLPGAILFIGLLAFQFLTAGRLPTTERSIGRGVVTAIALGSLFNSLILSVTGGLIFAYFSALAFAAMHQAKSGAQPISSDEAQVLATSTARAA